MATQSVATIYNENEFLSKTRITSLICGNTENNNTTRLKIQWWVLKEDTLNKKLVMTVLKYHLLCIEHVYKSFE